MGLLIQKRRIHIDHGFIDSSDLDQGSPIVARIMPGIAGHCIASAAKSDRKRKKLEDMLVKSFGMDMVSEMGAFMDQFA